MRERGLWIAVLILSTVAIVVLPVGTRPISAQGRAPHADKDQGASAYNPYPPGILPSNLSSEIARVQREVDVIEGRALARWHALEPPTLAGQPTVLQNVGTEATETLGELMLYDKNISPNRTEACAFCHMPYAGFSGPIPSVNLTMIAYPGSAHFRAGKRVAQRHPYAPFFPVLQYNQMQGLFFGGNFWDSRATGYRLRVPDAEQVQVSAFSSKFDAFLVGKYKLTADEMAGLKLFDGKGNCNSCHLDGRGTTLKPDQTDTSSAAQVNPLFTCFGSANEGLPLNPGDAFYYETKPDSYGFIPNPYGFGYRDLGLGAFLRSGFGSGPSPNRNWRQYAPTVDGQMQVSSIRDVALTPPQCPTTEAPGPYFQKEFFHNGYLKSLKQVVHFYNTRDKYEYPVTSGHCPAGTTEKVDCWPTPEVPNNIDMTSGNLGLTDEEENQIVVFMETLSDGFTRPYLNSDTFTGACMTGGSAATQGNESLIPTPPLPPCASAICDVAPVPGPKPISGNPPAQQSSTTSKARVRIVQGPMIELAKDDLTVIRWTTDNPGGSPVHYGVVHYGTNPKDISQTAMSPIRLNPDHSYTVFRVRIYGLKPQTTYYYMVDSMQATRNDDGVKSSVKHFTTP